MFDFFLRNNKETASGSVDVEFQQVDPNAKICPKCKRVFKPRMVICTEDQTLLSLVKERPRAQQTISSVVAKRADGSSWTLLCNKPIGIGSLCAAYEALDTSGGRKVVVKVLQSHLMCDKKAERRFLEGAQQSLSLDHPNIITEIGTGSYVDKMHHCARPFTVYEYVNGKQLSTLIDKEQLPTAADTLSIASDVCYALQYAHEKGIVHGDLKPSNIFLQQSGDSAVARICDFAIAERLFSGLEWERVTTMTCSLYGSATYLAPDYANSRQPNAVADLYSLGCIMYECLVGFPPFVGANDFMTIMQHMKEAPQGLAPARTPKVVSDIIMKALAKDPNERWQSAEQMNVAIKVAQKQLT